MLSDVWTALGDLKPGQAVVVTGFVGFVTLASGHLINAWLTRRRDNGLDSLQRKRAVQAFAAELTVVQTQFELSQIIFDNNNQYSEVIISVPKCISYTPFRADLVKNLSMLNDKQIITVANVYAYFDYFDAFIKGLPDRFYKITDIGSSIEIRADKGSFDEIMNLVKNTSVNITESRDAFLKADVFHSDRERELYASVLKDVLADVAKKLARKRE